jgi:hypothetical protein
MLTAMLAGYEQFLNETNRSLSEQGLETLATAPAGCESAD